MHFMLGHELNRIYLYLFEAAFKLVSGNRAVFIQGLILSYFRVHTLSTLPLPRKLRGFCTSSWALELFWTRCELWGLLLLLMGISFPTFRECPYTRALRSAQLDQNLSLVL